MAEQFGFGDASIEEAYRKKMIDVARALDMFFNGSTEKEDRKVGFILLVFEYGNTDGRCNYISNGADRKDVVVMMKEQIRRFEGAPDVKGTA